MKLGICVPTREVMYSKFAYSFSMLISKLNKNNIEYKVFFEEGSILPQQRINLVKSALAEDCTKILFLDSDMIFPGNVFDELLKHNKEIVACNYSTRIRPFRPTAFLETEEFAKTLKKTEGLVKVAACGFGIALIDSSVFFKLQEPWFTFEWKGLTHMGEDIYFCKQATNNGYEIYIDASLSNKCLHIASTPVNLDNV